MYIRKKSVMAFYKLFIGILALGLWWFLLVQHGWLAFRLFPTWVLGLAAMYFIATAAVLALRSSAHEDKTPCPMLEGMILMGFWLTTGIVIASAATGFSMPDLPVGVVVLTCGVLPVLVLLDWVLFMKKGGWRAIDPFNWLALPVCYAATMIFTAEILSDDLILWRYPLPIFDYLEFGLFDMLGWLLVVAILDLAVGYVFFLLDFAMSGKLGKKIVLPHIRTVVIDETGTERVVAAGQADVLEPADTSLVTKIKTQNPKQPQPARKPVLSKPKVKSERSKIPAPEIEITKVAPKTQPKANVKKNQPRTNEKSKVNHKAENELSQARNSREAMEKPATRLKTASQTKSKTVPESKPKSQPAAKPAPKSIKVNKSSVN